MTDLCELAIQHGTDKAGWYTPVYDLLLRDKREQIKTVLEIGIGTKEAMPHVPNYEPGASLRMWGAYFPNAIVFGADIVVNLDPKEPLNVFYLDQGNAAQLKKAGDIHGPFDLIVDDGSHNVHHQILSAQTLVPFLRKGGLYIIEDVNNFDEVMRGLDMPALCISYPTPYKHAARCMVIRGQY